MAKKRKDDVPNPNNVTNREVLQRMNFLYQASALLNHINAPKQPEQKVSKPVQLEQNWLYTPSRLESKAEKRKTRLVKRHPKTCEDLSKNYIQTMKAVGLKTNVRLCILSVLLITVSN